jgi:enoyl-CoA hydratase
MQDTATVLTDRPRPGVTLLTLNRPESLNSMSMELVRELHTVLAGVADDADCRVVVLTGAGRGFCSGHELAHIRGNGGAQPSVVETFAVQEAFASLTLAITKLPQPVIAAVNGPAAGGGMALALAADTRVCSASARFNAAFVRIGLSGCDVGVSYLLPRIVGSTLAFEMMLTGRLIDAEEALRAGLVVKVVPDGSVVDAALEIAGQICANSPFGVRMTKEVMRANLDAPSLQTAIDLENRTQLACARTNDMREAVAAFMDKRTPRFTNS